MSDAPFLGQVKIFGFNFAPRNHATCSGQLLSIAQNTALFSLLGTTYGGNGQTTFGLPDLRGRIGVNQGQGPGLPNYVLGELAGEENHTLIVSEIPLHTHQATATSNTANDPNPVNNVWANSAEFLGFAAAANTTMSPLAAAQTGSNTPHENCAPFLVINYSIALTGIFPSRN